MAILFHIYTTFENIDVPKNLIWMLNICLGPHRKPLVSAESTFIAALLITFHCWKRFYESHFVNIFSNKKMNISHYAIGFFHYIGTLICIIGESEGFFEDMNVTFSWRRTTYPQLICAMIFLISSYTQLKTNFILRNLRKDKNNEINTTIYKIPHGGLFEYVSGALQITEIIIYLTMSIILWQSSTFHFITIWVLVNQVSTAVLTHKWYIQTFQNYPKCRKILIPYLL
ncbi:polyprenal reductase isoform X2 [Megachile rotundata]|uniref:polyprenal reductase isoform X2 n=1 Tax=Megachile rotundata TaxID=143995 RepID=UPI003FCF25D3